MNLAYYDFLSKVEFRLSVLLSRWADLIISNSEAGRRYHIDRGYSGKRLVVIPNGIDVEQFKPDAAARREVRAEWNVPPHVRLVGLVGRIDPMKDHGNFLRAAARIAEARPDTHFVCVGPGEKAYRTEMSLLGKSLGLEQRLLWAGERTDIRRVYNALDLLVSASRFGEGLPNAIAEAMATGVPCVVTDVGDSALLVGDEGWVCPPGDSGALAHTMSTALSSLPVDTEAIRRRICVHYSTEALARGTAEQLNKILPVGPMTRGLTTV
jgi:glycosyltransferase involved in cell wall biosynthesis